MKRWNLKHTHRNISVPLAMYEHESLQQQKNQTLKEKKEKQFLAGCWGKIGLRNTRRNVFIRSGEIPSPRQTSVDKTNDCVMKFERGALVRGSDPPSGHSARMTAGVVYVAVAGQAFETKTFGRWCAENR